MKEGDRVVDKLVGFGVRWDAPDLGRGSWQWQTDHFNWKPCSEHCCILSGKLANVRNRCTFPILSPPSLLILHIFKVSLSFKCKAWCWSFLFCEVKSLWRGGDKNVKKQPTFPSVNGCCCCCCCFPLVNGP